MSTILSETIRPDFIFSYWIVCWTVIWFWHPASTTKLFNPLFALVAASAFVILSCIATMGVDLRLAKIDRPTILAGILSNLAIKGMPIGIMYYQQQCSSNGVVSFIGPDNVGFTVCLFAIYNGWLYVNNETFISVYTKIYDGLLDNHPVDGATAITKWILFGL